MIHPAWLCALPLAAAAAAGAAPNVVVIYTDDQGSLDLNCYGAEDLHTPNLDRLASEGVRFTQMYAPSAICSASRAGLLTGRFPAQAGVPGNVSSSKGVAGMPATETTMAEMFKAAGYATGHVGKWHLGYTPETMPNGQGFDSSYGHMGGCIDNYSHFFYWAGPNRHDLWRDGEEVWEPGVYFGDAMLREATAFVRANKEGPFFLYWAINWPHYPMQGAAPWREKYQELPSPRRQYATFVSTVDDYVGRLLKVLDAEGLRGNTVVVYQSDHGHSTEERAFGGGGFAGRYRGAKGCLFEGGLRVPSIVRWPDHVPAGETRDQMVVGCDWLPTLAEFAGATPPDELDGRSIAKVITDNAESPHEGFHWQLGKGANAQWVVREGPWKLLGNPRDTSRKFPLDAKRDRLFLVNLDEDIEEKTNVAAQHPEIVQRLSEARAAYAKDL